MDSGRINCIVGVCFLVPRYIHGTGIVLVFSIIYIRKFYISRHCVKREVVRRRRSNAKKNLRSATSFKPFPTVTRTRRVIRIRAFQIPSLFFHVSAFL